MDVPRLSVRSALVGDAIVLAVLTVIGFASHATLDEVPRLITTYLAFFVAWMAVAPWFGLFQEPIAVATRQVWRVGWAWVVAAPLGALLRSILLGRGTVDVTFVLVTIIINGLALVAWRLVLATRLGRAQAPTADTR